MLWNSSELLKLGICWKQSSWPYIEGPTVWDVFFNYVSTIASWFFFSIKQACKSHFHNLYWKYIKPENIIKINTKRLTCNLYVVRLVVTIHERTPKRHVLQCNWLTYWHHRHRLLSIVNAFKALGLHDHFTRKENLHYDLLSFALLFLF